MTALDINYKNQQVDANVYKVTANVIDEELSGLSPFEKNFTVGLVDNPSNFQFLNKQDGYDYTLDWICDTIIGGINTILGSSYTVGEKYRFDPVRMMYVAENNTVFIKNDLGEISSAEYTQIGLDILKAADAAAVTDLLGINS